MEVTYVNLDMWEHFATNVIIMEKNGKIIYFLNLEMEIVLNVQIIT